MNQIPTNLGKQVRCWGVRGSRVGDSVMAYPVLAWLRQRFPDCYTHWQIARRHHSSVGLWLNNPLIDQIVVSDCEEGMGPRDEAIAATCHIRFNVMPQHPDGDRAWATRYSIWEETWRMAGLPIEEYHKLSAYDQRCHLTQWFPVERRTHTIALWPASNYGVQQGWQSRFPSYGWSWQLVTRLEREGYQVIQCGHPNDYKGEGGQDEREGRVAAGDARRMPFMDQIALSLGCDAIIGTDSGSLLALAAYENTPTVQLLTDHMPGGQSDLAFASNSPTNVPLFARGSADNISLDAVLQAVHDVTSS